MDSFRVKIFDYPPVIIQDDASLNYTSGLVRRNDVQYRKTKNQLIIQRDNRRESNKKIIFPNRRKNYSGQQKLLNQISLNQKLPNHIPSKTSKYSSNPLAKSNSTLFVEDNSSNNDTQNPNISRNDSWSPTILIVGPGGLKGFMELGALAKLEEEHVLDRVQTYFGISVGSLISLLRIVGYSYREIAEIGLRINLFNGWEDVDLLKILQNNGIVSHDRVRKTLTESIITKLGILPSFEQLYLMTNKILRIVAYNLTKETTVYFDYQSHPNDSVIEVCLASCTIPILFYKFEYQGDYYCDGAIGNPYPINKVDDGKTDILGIYITSKGDTIRDENLGWYLDKVLHATMSEYRKFIIDQSSRRCKHLALQSDIKDLTGLGVSFNSRIEMYQKGRQIAFNFLNFTGETIIVKPRADDPIPYVPISNRNISLSESSTISPSHPLDGITNLNSMLSNDIRNKKNSKISTEDDFLEVFSEIDIDRIATNVRRSLLQNPRLQRMIQNSEQTSTENAVFEMDKPETDEIKLIVEDLLKKIQVQKVQKKIIGQIVPSIVSEVINNWKSDDREPDTNQESILKNLILSENHLPPISSKKI